MGRGGGGPSYAVRKSGDATVALVGFPSVGKSTLLNKLTNAESEVGAYDFTTLDVVPGVMEHRDSKIQILDVPGLIEGASSGKGRGREVISVVRNSDLILIMLSVFEPGHKKIVERELYKAGIRINTRPRDVHVKKKSRGGVAINTTIPLKRLDEATISSILHEYRVHNADVLIREDISEDELIDALSSNRVYTRAITVVNKTDLAGEEELKKARAAFPDAVFISADQGINIDELKESVYRILEFIRIYMKPQGEEADLEEPLIMKNGATVREVCDRLHRDFKHRFRFARIWGRSARYKGQRVGLDHRLADGDIVSLILEK